MKPARSAGEVERFRTAIARELGLQFEDARLSLLENLLDRRALARGCDRSSYLAGLESGAPREERAALAQELTVPETYLFRHIDQFHAFRDVALPELLLAPRAAGRVRVLSAGCASGDEAYSVAILLREAGAEPSPQVFVRGVDVNPAVLERAHRARFGSWALRETPPEVQRRWFREEGRELVLDASVRRLVSFDERNLVADDAELWGEGRYDVVFLRNVSMYFTPDHARGVVARIARALVAGGYLFLGHAETLRGLSHDFSLRQHHGAFFYQRKQAELQPFTEPSADAAALCAASEGVAPEAGPGRADASRRASQRIRTPRADDESGAPAGAARRVAPELAATLDLLGRERFGQALDSLQQLSSDASQQPDPLLLQAVLLAQSGDLSRAEKVCRELLELDELNAGAHYALALCHEGAGERRGAAAHDRAAIYLDPAFSMPRLHLGLLARRAGDVAGARRELVQALVLLEREDASRVLLFGGGFRREALIALCRAELAICGKGL
ncbi:MAG: CheR family methyltransferase [Myxococcota bacterium]